MDRVEDEFQGPIFIFVANGLDERRRQGFRELDLSLAFWANDGRFGGAHFCFSKIRFPASVRRYFCRLLRGLSGIVRSIHAAASNGSK